MLSIIMTKYINMETTLQDLIYFKEEYVDDFEIHIGRSLTESEKKMVTIFRNEKEQNDRLRTLCDLHPTFHVPLLTNWNGDCLFESLIYFGFGESVKDLRHIVASNMQFYKEVKGLFGENSDSLDNMFNNINEVKFIECNDGLYYEYDFELMCTDLTTKHSWSRLPTQLLLMMMSYIFRIEIIILNNKDTSRTKINAYENHNVQPVLQIIYLGHIRESHYFPLVSKSEPQKYYNKYETWVNNWIKILAKTRNNV